MFIHWQLAKKNGDKLSNDFFLFGFVVILRTHYYGWTIKLSYLT